LALLAKAFRDFASLTHLRVGVWDEVMAVHDEWIDGSVVETGIGLGTWRLVYRWGKMGGRWVWIWRHDFKLIRGHERSDENR
jgi:hypothetical protein